MSSVPNCIDFIHKLEVLLADEVLQDRLDKLNKAFSILFGIRFKRFSFFKRNKYDKIHAIVENPELSKIKNHEDVAYLIYANVDLNYSRKSFRFKNIKFALALHGHMELLATQLILWFRDLPRYPSQFLLSKIANYEYSKVKDVLEEIGYDDYKSKTCVLCGNILYSNVDWWCCLDRKDKRIGPCCMWGKCETLSKG